jgi:hypothetical protein
MPEIKPNYGISRIDQPEKKNHGFYVRITNKGKTSQKFFPDKSCGGKPKAQKMAKSYRDKIFNKLPKARQAVAASRRKKIKQSGVTGVTLRALLESHMLIGKRLGPKALRVRLPNSQLSKMETKRLLAWQLRRSVNQAGNNRPFLTIHFARVSVQGWN